MSTLKKLSNIGLALVLAFVTTTIFAWVLNYLFPDSEQIDLFDNKENDIRVLLYVCVFAPICEEFLWRWAPIELVRKFAFFEKIKWPFIVIVSALFGVWHGDYFNIFIQGIIGFFLGWVYIKNNFSYWSSTLTHATWNFSMCWLLPTIF